MNQLYKCRFCVKSYKEKFNYDRHVSVCKYLSQPEKVQLSDLDISQEQIPGNFELFQLVKHLSFRLDKLEKENQMLRQRQNKKKNVLEWLNNGTEEKPIITFERWLVDEIQPGISALLDTVFKKDLVSGVSSLFQNYFENNRNNKYPICCFTDKQTTFYVYDKVDSDIKWKPITKDILDKYIEHICHQFVIVFLKEWCEPNQELIATKEKYKEMYAEYYQKILGGTTSKEIQYSKIKHTLQSYLKHSIKNIVEYECE